MTHDRISADMSDLADYVGRNGRLSDDIGSAGQQHLGDHLALPATLFGDLGHESGLHHAVGEHITRMHDHVHRLAGSVRSLGHAVDGAKGDYEADEEHRAHTYRRIIN